MLVRPKCPGVDEWLALADCAATPPPDSSVAPEGGLGADVPPAPLSERPAAAVEPTPTPPILVPASGGAVGGPPGGGGGGGESPPPAALAAPLCMPAHPATAVCK